MDIEKLKNTTDESERVAAIYEFFDEDARLNRSKAARIEFLTTIHFIEKYLKKDAKILDLGAGAGEYSLHFARNGFDVAAIELAENNINAFKKKIEPEMKIDLRKGNAMDLSAFADGSFDIVLLFGPLYHLEREEDRKICIAEAKRVCKTDGTLFFAFVSHDMVTLTEFVLYTPTFLKSDAYDHDTFRLKNFPFIFFTVDECKQMLEKEGINILSAIASDGVSELLLERINALDDESYEKYFKYHLYCCEKPEMLGRSNHLLYIGKK